MPVTATGCEGSDEPGRAEWTNDARRVLRELLGILDRLVPSADARREAELPAEWFKYPPI
jgi:hypothetical protein